APDDRRLDPLAAEDLRHLRDVAEHVRQVADAHRPAQLGRTRETRLEIARNRLAIDEELVHERLPRPDREPAGRHERADPLLRLRPDLEVVVDRRELAVEREAQTLVALELVEHLVHDVDERHAKGLERAVPLPVPVRVRDEEDAYDLTEPASKPCTKKRCSAKKTISGTAINRKPAAARMWNSCAYVDSSCVILTVIGCLDGSLTKISAISRSFQTQRNWKIANDANAGTDSGMTTRRNTA